MIKTEDFDELEIATSDGLEQWLKANHNQKESIWLITYKKSVPGKYVSRWDVLDVLLCYGWIDGIRRKLDDHRTMQLIAPRRVQHWGKTYKDRAERLIDEDRMQASGLKSIADSKKSGLWNFMDDVDQLIIPEDLQMALSKNKGAELFFKGLDASSKRFALRWLKLSKTEKTRNNRIFKLVQLSAKGEKLPGS